MGISSAVQNSARARAVGISTALGDDANNNVVFIPQRVALIGQGSSSVTYSTDKKQFTSAADVGSTYGRGSPLHLAALQLLPENRDGIGTIPLTVYPLAQAGSGVASTGSITATGTQTTTQSYIVSINNIQSEPFVVTAGEAGTALEQRIADAINANVNMPVTASAGVNVVNLTSKWLGISSNDIKVKVIGTSAGITFAVAQPSGGLNNPSVQPALDQMGDVWETMVLNCLDHGDLANLDRIQAHGEGRWGALTRKPYIAFSGDTNATIAGATSVSDSRRTDRINSKLSAPGSDHLPLVVAARQLARIVVMANDNPAHDYGSLKATGLSPGADSQQWDYAQRDQAVKGGSSTTTVRDGVVTLSDIVTFYHPTGEIDPAYRYVVDIVKLQNVLYNIDRRFNSPEWDGAPLLPDGDFTVNRTAKFPSTARIEAADVVRQLGANAILADVENTTKKIKAAINDQNPKRLDMVLPVTLAGNANIFSIDVLFSFMFGSAVSVS